MIRKLLFMSFAVLFLTSSCSHKIVVQEAYQLEDRGDNRNNLPNNRVDMVTSFAGDNGYSFITFQIDIDNRSEHTIFLNQSDVSLMIEGNGKRRHLYHPIPKKDVIRSLEGEVNAINENKKLDTADGAIITGLDVLTGLLSGGNVVGSLIYGAASATDVISRRNQYNKAEKSVEEQIEYHEQYSLGRATIAPGESATFDVHFERPMTVCRAELEVFCAEHMYDFDYQLELRNIKVKD